MHVCIYVFMYVCMYVCMYVSYVCMYVCMIYMYIYIYIYTYYRDGQGMPTIVYKVRVKSSGVGEHDVRQVVVSAASA